MLYVACSFPLLTSLRQSWCAPLHLHVHVSWLKLKMIWQSHWFCVFVPTRISCGKLYSTPLLWDDTSCQSNYVVKYLDVNLDSMSRTCMRAGLTWYVVCDGNDKTRLMPCWVTSVGNTDSPKQDYYDTACLSSDLNTQNWQVKLKVSFPSVYMQILEVPSGPFRSPML